MAQQPPTITTTYSAADLTRLATDLITHRCTLKDISVVFRAGADANRAHRKGLRPLHYAVFEDAVDVVEYLIDEQGADVNVEDDVGFTPLHIGCKHGSSASVRALLSRGAGVNFVDTSPNTVGSELSRAMASLTVNPLSLAIENGHDRSVRSLLGAGADPNQKYFLGYEINLVPMEHAECLELLLEHGADPDVFSRGGLSPLMKACKDKRPEAVALLLRHGADVNLRCPPRFDRKTAIHYAAASGHEEIVRALMTAGAFTAFHPEYDHSPLEFAILGDKLSVVCALLELGADPNECNEERCSALQLAVSTAGLRHQRAILHSLLEGSADPNQHSNYFSYMGPSLAPLVEYLGYMEEYDIQVVRMLLAYGAQVNMTRPTRLLKIKDPHGLLGQVRKLRPYEDIFDLLLDATYRIDLDLVTAESSLSNGQKQTLLDMGRTCRDLRHLARLRIRQCLCFPLPPSINRLPIPALLQNYLLFNWTNPPSQPV